MVIRFAKKQDKNKILEFIDEHWQKNHIFVQWPELFDDYYMESENKLNFVIAEEGDTIFGICGFVKANRNGNSDIWLALWKAIASNTPGLGLDIVRYLHKNTNCRILCCCGIRKEVMRLYEFMGYKTGKLEHFYRLAERDVYKIAIVKEKNILPVEETGVKLVKMQNESQFKTSIDYTDEIFTVVKPYKDLEYIVEKYFHNIAYDYQVFGIGDSDASQEYKAFLIAREVEMNGAKILRIVDFLGDENLLQKAGGALEKLMQDKQYEYVDFYEFGLNEETLEGLGMVKLETNDENVIPNYFEPFLQENADIYIFTSDTENFRMFKADGDQERPNSIEVRR